MFSLTSHERKVLLLIGILILCGAVLKFFNVSFVRQKTTSEIKLITADNISSQNIAPKQIIINVNTASQEELEKLSGIGPEISRRIIEYRQEYGLFYSLEDLKKVKGIGEKKAQLIKEYITF
ncbi:MAG: helix-hairpin-helix domain-containing protein [Candidatus Omnitrophota bacterium]|nr:helix-hairpin-helix domain-containing protein [Candidatus Omnitrophota bacterium]